MYTVSAESHFDAAHFLKGYPGKCANIHGHRWKVVAEVAAEELDEGSMVVDFKDLKGSLKALADNFDHALVLEAGSLKPATVAAFDDEGFRMVEIPCRPTAENLAKLFFDALTEDGLNVRRVEVYETPENRAVYEA